MRHSSAIVFSILLPHLRPSYLVSAKPGRLPQYSTDADNNVINNYNERYTVSLTVAGTQVNAILDTGSTDMWVAPPNGLKDQVDETGAFATIFYGDGSAFVNGSVELGDVEIAGNSIPHQAFINVLNSVGQDSDFSNGIFGLVGLGFDGPSGSIPSSLTQNGLNGTDVGKAVLTSIFAQNPTNGQFFSLSLSRVGDVDDSADASLTISGFDPKYAAVAESPLLFQFPYQSGRWGIVSDGIWANNEQIRWKSFSESLQSLEQNAVLLDTGTTNFLVPAEVRDAIYSSVPGALVSRNSSIPNLKFSEDQDTWVLPCKAIVNLTTRFAGQDFPIHPLDLSDIVTLTTPNGKQYTACLGSITNGGPILGPGLDALYGDSFLRNVYSVFSFGDGPTPPHVQLLADTVINQAAADFIKVRVEQLENGFPELGPADLIRLFDGPNAIIGGFPSITDASPSGSANSDDMAGAGPSSSNSTCVPGLGSDLSELSTESSKNSVNLADSKWGPAIVGLLAANLVILLVVAFFSVMNYVRNGRTTGVSKAADARYVPVKLKEDSTFVPARTSYEEHGQERYSD
ncbi:Six-hairpin glycosidase [Mycena indigotica]|uniref:Six-hairpin glycosidase n=1 Tax=Mycena indigotica TaxID=2126181 RepID=A0A8H6TC68_9AGAR|nr:Six-hairpin glycosidase [Mycena indigotica]KAF7315008.1 Six-hairpin glycosidase [Mycena indigotica]